MWSSIPSKHNQYADSYHPCVFITLEGQVFYMTPFKCESRGVDVASEGRAGFDKGWAQTDESNIFHIVCADSNCRIVS